MNVINPIVIEHVKVRELPEAWREKLATATDAHVTVRVEAERAPAAVEAAEPFATDDPAFGMRRDREDMADVEAYLRTQRGKLHAPRYTRE